MRKRFLPAHLDLSALFAAFIEVNEPEMERILDDAIRSRVPFVERLSDALIKTVVPVLGDLGEMARARMGLPQADEDDGA